MNSEQLIDMVRAQRAANGWVSKSGIACPSAAKRDAMDRFDAFRSAMLTKYDNNLAERTTSAEREEYGRLYDAAYR